MSEAFDQFIPTPLIVPTPKYVKFADGFLNWSMASFDADDEGLPIGNSLSVSYVGEIENPQGYELTISEDGISVRCANPQGAKYALQTLRQMAMQADERGLRFAEISDYPDLQTRGFMLDISRCKVPTEATLARLVDMLALFKYNRLELYTEHTYSFEGHELVWGCASPMTPSRYARLQRLCKFSGIELVANMNGLGHMERWLRYPQYQHLAESKAPFVDPLGTIRKYPTTLYPDSNALEFIDSLYEQFLPNFESDKINIGGDEPWELGMGRSQERAKNEPNGKYAIYIDHILGLYKLCKKRGKKVYFWADVLMQKPEYSKILPPDMTPILWGYYLDHPYEEQCKFLHSLGRNFLVAPGTNTWLSFGSRWDCAFQNIITACECAKKYNSEGMLLTQWGDDGNHQPWCAMYPAIVHGAACSWGKPLQEHQICSALDKFIFADSTGEFSRALCALGRVDPVQKLFCYYRKLFFVTNEDVKKLIDSNPDFNLDKIFASLDFALSLAAVSKPQCKDADICLAEFALAGEMIRWAIARAKNDHCVESDELQKSLKMIAMQYCNVWLARAELGGLDESVAKIKSLCPKIFE